MERQQGILAKQQQVVNVSHISQKHVLNACDISCFCHQSLLNSKITKDFFVDVG